MRARVPPPNPKHVEFLSAYGPAITDLALRTRGLVLEEAPDAVELVYDAYNAVAAGYSFTGRPSDAFVHVAAYAHWVNLGFNRGSQLPDPGRLLQGGGRWVRHLRISRPADLAVPPVRAFVREAAARAPRPAAGSPQPRSVVRGVYPRKRRPAGAV
jgi:hypothetical protein